MHEHKCPCCGKTCMYDREGHKCVWCLNVHWAPLSEVVSPKDLHIPGPDPVRDEELIACVAVAEIHALAKFKLKYIGHHRGSDGCLHLDLHFGQYGVEIQSDAEHDIYEGWTAFKEYLQDNGIFGKRGKAA